MDGPRDYHTKWSKPDKDNYRYMILLIYGILKKDKNKLIHKTQTHKHRREAYSYQRGQER